MTSAHNIGGCIHCGWIYKDTPGMGIHQAPMNCPICDHHIRAYPEQIWLDIKSKGYPYDRSQG